MPHTLLDKEDLPDIKEWFWAFILHAIPMPLGGQNKIFTRPDIIYRFALIKITTFSNVSENWSNYRKQRLHEQNIVSIVNYLSTNCYS